MLHAELVHDQLGRQRARPRGRRVGGGGDRLGSSRPRGEGPVGVIREPDSSETASLIGGLGGIIPRIVEWWVRPPPCRPSFARCTMRVCPRCCSPTSSLPSQARRRDVAGHRLRATDAGGGQRPRPDRRHTRGPPRPDRPRPALPPPGQARVPQPGGSVKDRPALAMIRAAEAAGSPGGAVAPSWNRRPAIPAWRWR